MEWEDLNRAIEDLEALTPNVDAFAVIRIRHSWRPVWDQCKLIQDGFKAARYPTVVQRNVAWDRFQRARLEASERKRVEDSAILRRSEPIRDEILGMVKYLKVDTVTDAIFLHDTTVAEMKRLSQALGDARRLLREHREGMVREHVEQCHEAIGEVQLNHDWWWEKFKAYSYRRTEEKLERQREFDRRRIEREERRNDRRDRIRNNIGKNEQALEKAREALQRQRYRLVELEAKRAETRSNKWEGIYSQWIAEAEEKIESIEAHIDTLRSWIAEGEAQLRAM